MPGRSRRAECGLLAVLSQAHVGHGAREPAFDETDQAVVEANDIEPIPGDGRLEICAREHDGVAGLGSLGSNGATVEETWAGERIVPGMYSNSAVIPDSELQSTHGALTGADNQNVWAFARRELEFQFEVMVVEFLLALQVSVLGAATQSQYRLTFRRFPRDAVGRLVRIVSDPIG